MARFFSVLLLLAVAVTVAPALAKDFKSMPAIDGGGRWLFAYQERAKKVEMTPAAAYGATYTQIIDFSWARNVSFDVSYLHSRTHGEIYPESGSDTEVFDLTLDTACANIGYFFTGRRFLPHISGGFGAAFLNYEPESNRNKLWETDPMLNLGGGVDYSLWEAEKSGALDRALFGARVRYEYVFVQRVFNAALNDLAITARLELRF